MTYINTTVACVTSDGTSLYGLTDTMFLGTYTGEVAVVKSNPNPKSLADVSWTVLSSIDMKDMYFSCGLLTLGTGTGWADSKYYCSVSAQGVFTLLCDNTGLGPTTAPMVQYNPKGPKNTAVTSKGPGSWQNITVPAAYNWTGYHSNDILFYDDSVTSQRLWHVYHMPYANTIKIGYVDPASQTLVSAGTWSVGLPTSPYQFSGVTVAYGNGQISAYWLNGTSSTIFMFQLSDYASPAPTLQKSIATPASSVCDVAEPVVSAFYQKSYYMVCVQYLAPGSPYMPGQLFVVQDTTVAAPLAQATSIANASFVNGGKFVPIGAIGASPFAFVPPSFAYVSYGLTLGQPNQGIWQGPVTMTVVALGSSSPLSIGAIVGIVVGVLALFGIVGFCLFRRSKAKKNAVPAPPAPNVTPAHDFPKEEVQSPPGELKGGMLGQIQFSQHPRPNFTTTLGDNPTVQIVSPEPLQQQYQPLYQQQQPLYQQQQPVYQQQQPLQQQQQ
ncbi:hypothetical protein EDD21DRAFT_447973 [Dissophora ornata]|nr:hypothetical protein BGZ58_007714 [Dissophora ornata]KAI8596269.1 hypothetical protein EDD21DRAFT_447973 [Dissophora ornata]